MHGFTASPDEMRPLGEALAAAGFPVRAVRVAGHGTSIDDFATATAADWIASVREAAEALARTVDRLAIVGMSMGALLALELAPGLSPAALVLCGPALEFADPRLGWVHWLGWLPRAVRQRLRIPKGSRDVADPARAVASFTYDAVPLGAVLELVRLRARVAGRLAAVSTPTLVLHGALDRTIPPHVVDRLRARIGTDWLEHHLLPASGHVVVLDAERERVAALAADFLGRVEARGA